MRPNLAPPGLAPSRLAQFQDDFSHALVAGPESVQNGAFALARQPGFAVYRNTVMKGWIDALQANYPAVARLVGEEWFRATAAVYARSQPPGDARMLCFGAGFAEFLTTFESAAALPYLPGVARLDRMWTEAHVAADAPALEPAQIAGLAPEQLSSLMVAPHPAARWAWFPEQPVYSVWRRNREQDDMGEVEWCAEGALLTRPDDAVAWTAIDAAACAFLDACVGGAAFSTVAVATLQAYPDADLARTVAALFETGALLAPQSHRITH